MREVKVDIPSKYGDGAEKVLGEYTDEVSSSEIKRNEESFVEITATIDQEDLDSLTEELKSLEVDSGDLSIKVFEQESLIEKGKTTRGAKNTVLSKQEIYSKAQSSQSLNTAQWAMLGLAGSIAGLGLTTGNLILLIGAILLAPILYPLSSISISIAMGDKDMLVKSIKNTLGGVLVISAFSAPVFFIFGESDLNVLIEGAEIIVLSVFVGGAAILTFISEFKEEMAGAALAIAIVPPAVVAAESIIFYDSQKLIKAIEILSLNIASAVISGYAVLALFKINPLTDYREDLADRLKLLLLAVAFLFGLFLLSNI